MLSYFYSIILNLTFFNLCTQNGTFNGNICVEIILRETKTLFTEAGSLTTLVEFCSAFGYIFYGEVVRNLFSCSSTDVAATGILFAISPHVENVNNMRLAHTCVCAAMYVEQRSDLR